MSTRSKTRKASTSQASPTPSVVPKAEPRSRRKITDVNAEKENSTIRATNTSKTNDRKTGKALSKEVDCTCTRGDDGSPMVQCALCRIWYHFTCVDLSEPEAEDISIFVCPTCMESTGRQSIMNWEGPSAFDGWPDGTQTTTSQPPPKRIKHLPEPKSDTEESDGDPSSDDEYVVEESKSKGRVKKQPSVSFSESDSDSANDGRPRRRRLHKASTSPPPSSLKRKNTNASTTQAPPSKKKKAASVIATDDPTRRYCLGKLGEILRDVFLRYPHIPTPKEEGIEGEKQAVKRVEKKPEEISDEEKAHILEQANRFSTELEQCIYDIYCEPDKQGEPYAGGKYKDRFRMLQFNLSKSDRVAIHRRIASGSITPKEISLMSSTDLADEETKQNIKIAEQEALEHSILQKSTVPRAKITHKGLQDIEDVNGELVALREREREREREQEEEERRERERMARVRLAQTQQRQRTASVSVPPESPVVSQKSPTWGAPPPVPAHAMTSPGEETISPTSTRPPPNPLFVHTASELSVPEPELNLADIINIEDETSGHDAAATEPSPASPSSAGSEMPTQADADEKHGEIIKQPPPTGISPFAAMPSVPSFDLSSLWSGPSVEVAPSTPSIAAAVAAAAPSPKSPPRAAPEEHKDVIMESEISHGTQDQDFDMFLEEKEEKEQAAIPPAPIQPKFEDLPRVWSGKLGMPLDSIMQETAVVARQLGGRPIDDTSLLWKTLFPAELLRIDGRVATESSCNFLTQTRLNPTKELIAVAFSPANAQNDQNLKAISDFLIGKNRHGLIFPWGMPAKDYSPGRELYVIPLRATDPLPECIELLDHLKLPKERTNDYLIGVWVLYKGRLAPPPQMQPLTSPVQAPPLPPLTANITSTMFGNSPSAPPTSRIDTSALAKEVATLTPEQIQNVLRTLAATSQVPLPSQAPQLQPQIPGQLPSLHALPPMSMLPQQPQPWTTQPPAPFPAPYQAPMPMPPPPPGPHGPGGLPPLPFDRQDQRRDTKPPGPLGSDKGDRPRGRRGRRRDGGSSPRRPVDSGWAQRKAWTEARGGGPSSPTRRW